MDSILQSFHEGLDEGAEHFSSSFIHNSTTSLSPESADFFVVDQNTGTGDHVTSLGNDEGTVKRTLWNSWASVK